MEQEQHLPPTPLVNRIFFAVIAALIIADPISMIVLYKNGADTPTLTFWMIFAALPIIALILATFKGNIRLRISKLWTPLGIAAIIFTAVLLVITYDGTSWNNLTESVYYVFGIGLLIAFVDLKILQDYAYFFAFYGLLCTLESFPAGFQAVQMTLDKNLEWGAWVDEILFLSGPIFLYAFVKRMRTNPPGWKKTLLSIGGFIIGIVLTSIIGTAIGKAFPEKSWSANWLANKKPTQSVICTGDGCGQGIYVEPYKEINVSIPNGAIGRSGIQGLPLIMQDHGLLGCSFNIDSYKHHVVVTCKKTIKGTSSKELILEIVDQKDMKEKKDLIEIKE